MRRPFLGTVIAVSLLSFTAMAKTKPKSEPSLASMVPVPMLKPTANSEIVKFISCQDEDDCLVKLQEVELGEGKDASAPMVAEFVETPKKGIVVYRKGTLKK